MILSWLLHPLETFYIIQYKLNPECCSPKELPEQLVERPNLRICYDFLNKTSRSFSLVIQQLGPELRDAICLFYLILRGLDTIGKSFIYERGVGDSQIVYRR
jgi:farnesyl-diphosphate farnesyltransferase